MVARPFVAPPRLRMLASDRKDLCPCSLITTMGNEVPNVVPEVVGPCRCLAVANIASLNECD